MAGQNGSGSRTSSLPSLPSGPIKIFIAGDKSQVGKTSVCLGLLGSLLELGYQPSELAYIKPATQCESVQLVAKYCQQKGIKHEGIGPIVYYAGFTREFLKGNTQSSSELLREAAKACDEIGSGKKVLIVDGVGFPAVGSITGTSNANVAVAVGAPVMVVCPRGVGNAVDSFNLNASFFEAHGAAVLGGLCNRLESDGYYSKDKCKAAVDEYFSKFRPQQRMFGYVPELEGMKNASPPPPPPSTAAAAVESLRREKVPDLTEGEEALIQQFVKIFSENTAVLSLLKAAEKAIREGKTDPKEALAGARKAAEGPSWQRGRIDDGPQKGEGEGKAARAGDNGGSESKKPKIATRAEIEAAARMQGAACGA